MSHVFERRSPEHTCLSVCPAGVPHERILNIRPTEDVPPPACVTAGCKLCVVSLSNMNVNPRDAGLLPDKSEASFINRLWCISSVYARVHILHQTFLFFSWVLDLKAHFCMCKHNSSGRQHQY